MYNEEKINNIKKMYPIGTRIKLISMEDNYNVPSGTQGTIDFIDDEGQIHMKWDNGSTLALIYGVDSFEKIDNEKIKNTKIDRER